MVPFPFLFFSQTPLNKQCPKGREEGEEGEKEGREGGEGAEEGGVGLGAVERGVGEGELVGEVEREGEEAEGEEEGGGWEEEREARETVVEEGWWVSWRRSKRKLPWPLTSSISHSPSYQAPELLGGRGKGEGGSEIIRKKNKKK